MPDRFLCPHPGVPSAIDPAADDERTGGPLSRRAFLGGSAALVVATTLVGTPAWAATNPLVAMAQSGPGLSVGYVQGSAAFAPDRTLLASDWVAPARSIAAAPASLGAAGRLRVVGLLPRSQPAAVRRVDLDLLVPVNGVAVPYLLWTLRGANASASSSSVVRVATGPTFALRGLVDGATGPSTAVFAGGTGTGYVRLRAGTYLVGLAPKVWDTRRTVGQAVGDSVVIQIAPGA